MSDNNVYLMNQDYVSLFEDFMTKVNELPNVKIYIDAIHSDADNKAVYQSGTSKKSDTLQIDIASGDVHTLYAFQMPQNRLLDSKGLSNSPLRFKNVSIVKSNIEGPAQKQPLKSLSNKFMRYSTQAINSLTRSDDGRDMLCEMIPESPEDNYGMYDVLAKRFSKLYDALASADIDARKSNGLTVDLFKHMQEASAGDPEMLSGQLSSLNLLSVYGRCKGLTYVMPAMAAYAARNQVVVTEDTAVNIIDGGSRFTDKQERNKKLSAFYADRAGCACCYPKLIFTAKNEADNKPKLIDEYCVFRNNTNTKTPYARITEDGEGFKIKYKGMYIGFKELYKESDKQDEKATAIKELREGFPFIDQLTEFQLSKLVETEFKNIRSVKSDGTKVEIDDNYGIDMLSIDLKAYHQAKDGKLKSASRSLLDLASAAQVGASNYDLAKSAEVVDGMRVYGKEPTNGDGVAVQESSRAVASQNGMYATIKSRVLGTVDMVKMGSLVENIVEDNGALNHVQGAVKADSTYRSMDTSRALDIRKKDQALSYLIGSEVSSNASDNENKMREVIQTSDDFAGYRALSSNWNRFAIDFNNAVATAEATGQKSDLQNAVKSFMKLNDFTTMIDVYDMKTVEEFDSLGKDIDTLYATGDKIGVGSLYRPQSNYEVDVIRTIINTNPKIDKSLFTVTLDENQKPLSFKQIIDKVVPKMSEASRETLAAKCDDIGKIADTFEDHVWADMADVVKPSKTNNSQEAVKQLSQDMGIDIADSI